MVSLLRLAAFFVLAVHLGSCATTLRKPTGKPVHLQTRALQETPTLTSLTLDFPWALENPNPAALHFQGINWTFQLTGAKDIEGTETETFQIAPHTGEEFNTSITVPLPKVSLDRTPDNTLIWRYTLLARFKLMTSGKSSIITKTWRGELFPPHPPKVSVLAEGARYSNGSYELDFFVTVENPNAFPIQLEELPYTLNLHNTTVHQGVLGRNQYIQPGTGLEFEVHKALERHEYGPLLERLRNRPQIPYTFDCHIQLPKVRIHRALEGFLSFE